MIGLTVKCSCGWEGDAGLVATGMCPECTKAFKIEYDPPVRYTAGKSEYLGTKNAILESINSTQAVQNIGVNIGICLAIKTAKGWQIPHAKSPAAIQQNIVATEIVQALQGLLK